MADSTDGQDSPPARRRHTAAGETVTLRQASSDADTFEVRMPVATTGEVRNEGDDPLTRAELVGMADQINDRVVPVFPDHGRSGLGGPEYAAVEKLGEWHSAEVQPRESGAEHELVATAELMDPETMPAAAGALRQTLSAIKEQVKRGMSLASSIGWRTDSDYPGGVDLMEASIVGIGADPRTTSQDAEVPTLARAAVAAGADPEAFVREVREAVGVRDSPDPDGARPLGPPGDRDRFDSFDECVATLSEDDDVSETDAQQICGAWEQASKGDREARAEYDVNGETVEITPPEAMVNAAEAALEAKQEFDGLADCGTGVGEDRARQLVNDEVGPDVVDEIAAYLTSHAEDVAGTDDPPTDWGEAEWTDGCGHVQYALWGGTATGTGLEWAQDRANAVAEARGEELPYPDRAARNLDDPAFSEGDAVTWSWQGEPVHGRVADIGAQFTVSGNTITGEEGEAVYLIHDWDEQQEAYDREGTAKPESSLSESQMDLPPATEDNFMSADTDPGDDQQAGTDGSTDTQTDDDRAAADIGEDDVAEFVSETYSGVDAADVVEAMNEAGGDFTGLEPDTVGWFVGDVLDLTAGEVMEMLPDGDGEQEMDDDGEEEEDEDMEEMAAELQSLREDLAETRQALADGDTSALDLPGEDDGDAEADAGGERGADGGDGDSTDDSEAEGQAAAGPAWRA